MIASIWWRDLAAAIDAGAHEHIVIVGGGGKTTTMFELGTQLDGRRVLTTTTKMGADQHRGFPVLLNPSDADIVRHLDADHDRTVAATGHPRPVVAWKAIDGSKAVGVSPQDCDRWFGVVDHVIVEADGARRRPFKAPKTGEPVVPATTTRFVIVMGANALGRVILDRCHRPLRVAALAGCQPGDRLTPSAAARVLLHQRGYRPHVPQSATVTVVVTQTDPDDQSAQGIDRHRAVQELAERVNEAAMADPWLIDHHLRIVLIRSQPPPATPPLAISPPLPAPAPPPAVS